MGLFKAIKDAIIVNEEDQVQVPETEKQLRPPVQKQVESPISTPSIATVEATPGVVDEKLKKHFQDLFDNSNIEGPDYYEFRKALEANLQLGLGLTDEVRYKMVFGTMSSSQRLQVETLLTTANQYIDIFKKDFENFSTELDTKKTEGVANREKEIEDLKISNQEKGEEIKRLTDEITQNNKLIGEKTVEKENLSVKLNQKQSVFTTLYNQFVQSIQEDITKITQYLK